MPNHREFLHRTWWRCSMAYPSEPRPLGDSPIPRLAIEDAVADPAPCDMAVSDTGGESCGDVVPCPAAWHPATVGRHALMALLPTPDRAAFFDTAPARRPRSSLYITNAYPGRYARRKGRFAALWTIARIPVPRRATHARLCVEYYRWDPDSPPPPIGELVKPGLPETVIRRRLVGMTDAPETPDTANYLLELRR
ncbi:hypothetical protein [Corynebacterium sp.]|uniref:hypothetical protein n=1 Tax=Corynebacterium sp. TaxID=1720 RepID=UPI0026DADF15|nr:hypothetical protein [Corynebacterium sp.]MDO4609712.1 hypothetical protein [Corynebacterium sp.]